MKYFDKEKAIKEIYNLGKDNKDIIKIINNNIKEIEDEKIEKYYHNLIVKKINKIIDYINYGTNR